VTLPFLVFKILVYSNRGNQ